MDRVYSKDCAKQVLKNTYLIAFFVCLFFALVNGFVSIIGDGVLISIPKPINYYTNTSIESINARLNYDKYYTIVIIIFILISALVFLLCAGVLEVGVKRFFLETRQNKPQFSIIFYGFKTNYWNIVKITFIVSVKIILWSLLFIIPGIIKTYEYRMIPSILAENPDIETNKALEIARLMTKDCKVNLFMLDLSFILWLALNVIPISIITSIFGNPLPTITTILSFMFVNPYIQATYAEVYDEYRDKVIRFSSKYKKDLIGISSTYKEKIYY